MPKLTLISVKVIKYKKKQESSRFTIEFIRLLNVRQHRTAYKNLQEKNNTTKKKSLGF